ncbi:MAG: c-type cytochrome domain-containing protein [Fuerstiella sp.]
MNTTSRIPLLSLCLVLALICTGTSAARGGGELTSEHRKELSSIRREMSKVSSLIRRRKLDEVERILDDVESRLRQVADEADLSPGDRLLASVTNLLVRQRHGLALRRNPKKYLEEQNTVSFVKHVAPILKARCVECHADDPSGKLKLDTFAGMKKGGKTGPLLVMGNANRSLIMYRLAASEQHRMPLKESPLSPNELSLLALWINQGAKFDGANEEHDLDELLDPRHVAPPKEFPKPTGGETVSFRNDIAPFMAAHCLRCHQGKMPSGQLLLVDFESIMQGGRHGRILIPGNPDESLMYQLMASYDEANRMPLEGKVTKKNFEDLGTWIREGARYDGGNSRLHLRALNPADSEMRAAELATLTAEQFRQFRETRSTGQWKKVFPDVEPKSVTSTGIQLYGNVSTGRLTEVQEWSDTHLETLRELFALNQNQPLWRGGLSVFVFGGRGEFETFNQQIALRRVFTENHGTTLVSSTFEDALVILHDTGDRSDGTAPTLEFSLVEQLTSAYLATIDATYPEWVVEGLGPALAARQVDDKDKYADSFRGAVVESLRKLEKPADVFHDGVFFSSEQARPVAVTVTQFLLKRGRVRNFAKLMTALQAGGDIDNSIRIVYGADPDVIARAYFSDLKIRRR